MEFPNIPNVPTNTNGMQILMTSNCFFHAIYPSANASISTTAADHLGLPNHGHYLAQSHSTIGSPAAVEKPFDGDKKFVMAYPKLSPGESGPQIILKPTLESPLEACFPVFQNPDQRCAGPPYGHKGPRPSADCEVYIAKLPKHIYEDGIYGLFSRAGPIFQIRINTKGIYSRGYCYVVFYTKEAADRAVSELNGYKFAGTICKDRDPGLKLMKTYYLTRLFVGGIPRLADDELVFNQLNLSRCGHGLLSVDVPRHLGSGGENLGYCFLEYKDHLHALAGWEWILNLSPFGSQQKLVVHWALPENQRPEDPEEIGTYAVYNFAQQPKF